MVTNFIAMFWQLCGSRHAHFCFMHVVIVKVVVSEIPMLTVKRMS